MQPVAGAGQGVGGGRPVGPQPQGPARGARPEASPRARFQQILADLERAGGRPPDVRDREARLAWAAREMEAFFIQELWRVMRRSIPEGGLFSSSAGSKVFEEMLDEERSRLMAASGQVGLAALVYEKLLPYADIGGAPSRRGGQD